MAALIKVLTTVLLVATVVFHATSDDVSAQTHHVVVDVQGFNTEDGDSIVELEGPEQLLSLCDLSNPIRMYTDHVVLKERAGTRYFTVSNLESCMEGLRVPVTAEPRPEDFEPPLEPEPKPVPVFTPPSPFVPPPEPKPMPVYSPPPPEPVEPPQEPKPKPVYSPSPPEPVEPPPEPKPVYPPPPPPSPLPPPPPRASSPPPFKPSVAVNLKGFSYVLLAGLVVCYIGNTG